MLFDCREEKKYFGSVPEFPQWSLTEDVVRCILAAQLELYPPAETTDQVDAWSISV